MNYLDLDLRALELFCCVYERGSLADSSEFLHLSQSTISFHIHQLEKSIGLKLFYKKGRKLFPTSNAHMLYPYARKLVELKQSTIEEIRLLKGSYKGFIKIGASTVPGKYLLPKLVCRYISRNPNTKIELSVNDSQIVVSKLESGEIDLGFIGFNYLKHNIEAKEVWEDEIVFIGNQELKDEMTVDELLGLPFILREATSGTRKFMENHLLSLGIDLKRMNVILEVNSSEILLEALSRLKAVSYLSSHLVQNTKPEGVKVIRIEGIQPPNRKFYLIYSSERPQSPALRHFLSETERTLRMVPV